MSSPDKDDWEYDEDEMTINRRERKSADYSETWCSFVDAPEHGQIERLLFLLNAGEFDD